MSLLAPRQIARRALFARNARYKRDPSNGENRSSTTRGLHLLLLLTVIVQLLSSEVIRIPLPGNPPTTLFILHEYSGIGSLGLIMIFWLWTLIRHGERKLGRLVPWLLPRRILDVLADVSAHLRMMRAAASRTDAESHSNGALASAIHGLGLLVVTGMAATGTVFFFTHGTPLAHQALDLHRLIANFMWAYLIGHAGMAALHHLIGSDILLRMFWVRRGIMVTTPRDRGSERTPKRLTTA
jgi:cytochrome b561